MATFQNTVDRGFVRYIVFKDGGVWYAVGLEFNIVESGDSPREAMVLLFEAISGYVESAKKMKARPYVLNQTPDSEYASMWKDLQNSKSKTQKSSKVYTFGSLNLSRSGALAAA